MKDEATVSPIDLANEYYLEACDFLRARLNEAMEAGHIAPPVASDVFTTFCNNFRTLMTIAEGGRYGTDLPNAANSALTILMAAFTAGSRDPSFLNRVKRVEGVRRAARARESKAKTSGSQHLNEAILTLANEQKKSIEDLSNRRDRMLVSARIKPSIDERVKELLRQGFNDAKILRSNPSKNVSFARRLLSRRTAR